MSRYEKIFLLKELGFNEMDSFVIDKKGNFVLDRYTEEKISIDNMAIFPTDDGILALDNNELSIASYLEFYGDEEETNKVEAMKFTQAYKIVRQVMGLKE